MTLDMWEIAARHFEPAPPNPYLTDPQAWARDKLGAHLWSKQRDLFTTVAAHRRTAVRSCHGSGKSFSAGVLAAWWIDVHPPGEAIVVSTAPTYRQVHAILWEEIRKQHRRGDLPGIVLQTDEWKIGDVLVGIGSKPADHDEHGFQGIHRRYVLVILDEACGIPDQLWTAVEAITTNADCRILAIGNPDDPNTEFGRVFTPGSGWTTLHISVFDTPNFTDEHIPDELRHLLPDPEWAADAKRKWGEDSPRYQSKVLGEFPELSEDTLIPNAWITAAQNRDLDVNPSTPGTLAVDVARYGSDSTVTAIQRGGRVRVIESRGGQSTMETAGRTIHHLTADPDIIEVRVDGVGVGGGVVDSLAEQGHPVLDMQAGAGSTDPRVFTNARAEWYWCLRKLFEDELIDLDPDDDETASQLASIRYAYTSRGQIKIESKDDMRKRGMPSPDRADAVMMACAKVNLPPPAHIVHAEDLLDEDDLNLGWADAVGY